MRILAVSDLQIGAGATLGRTLADYDELLSRVVDVAAEQQVSLCLGLGDAFQSRSTNRDQDEVFLRFLRAMSDHCPVLWVNGNHDWRGYERASTVGIFGDMGVEIAEKPRVHRFTSPAGTTAIAVLPWAALGHLRTSEDDRGRAAEQAAEHLVTIAAGLREQIEPDETAVLAGHWAVTGASLPTGLPTEMLTEPVVEISELAAQGWDAICLGHVHKAQTLDVGEGCAFVCGSPYVCDWGEIGFDHGVWVLEGDPATSMGNGRGLMVPRFVRIPDHRFATIDLSGAQALAITDAEWHGAPVADAMVRIRVHADEEQARRLNLGVLRREALTAGAYFVAPIHLEVARQERARVEGLSDDLDELGALELFLESQEITGSKAEALREQTRRYLEVVA